MQGSADSIWDQWNKNKLFSSNPHLQLGQDHELIHYDALPKHVKQAHRSAFELGFRDHAFADSIHKAQVPVYHIHTPRAYRAPFFIRRVGSGAPTITRATGAVALRACAYIFEVLHFISSDMKDIDSLTSYFPSKRQPY